ncbi:MAG: lysis protein [Pseudomonas sp.]|nr:lysis protein [Pseudomonas sp.]
MEVWAVGMIRYAAVALAAFLAAWYVQGLRWDKDVRSISLASANATVAAVGAINSQLIQSRAETESIRATYLSEKEKANREIDDLERRVTAGPERMYIKARCPTGVPDTGADAARADTGAAELSAASTADYLSYERLYAQQFGLLQFCRAELKKRSSPGK